MTGVVVIVPASNEEGYIGRCLAALAASHAAPPMQVIVSANACRDATVERARALSPEFAAAGHVLQVIDSSEPGKLGALNRAEAAIAPEQSLFPRIFLDADVICEPDLVGQVARALSTDQPRYATGTLAVMRARSAFTRAYARLWQCLPFVQGGAVGAGFFAVNAAGRARWGAFPAIISDDTFVRLNFTVSERIEVPARYHWPMVEGFRALVKVRRRQDAGVEELQRLYPGLIAHEAKAPVTKSLLLRLALRRPLDLAAYLVVHLAVRRGPKTAHWTRGR